MPVTKAKLRMLGLKKENFSQLMIAADQFEKKSKKLFKLNSNRKQMTLVIDIINTLITKADYKCRDLLEVDKRSKSFFIIGPASCKASTCKCGTTVYRVIPHAMQFIANIV